MWNWIEKLHEFYESGTPLVIATVSRVSGSTPRNSGAKMLVRPHGQFFGTIGGGHLELQVLKDAQESLTTGVTQSIRYPLGAKVGQCCGGVVEVLYEPIHCGPQLYVFGAGHVGQEVCRTFLGTPFTVHLIDPRPEWVESAAISKEIIRHLSDWSDFAEGAQWNPDKTYAVIMTHRHDLDYEIIRSLLKQPMKYLGLIGSHSKWERFKQRLLNQGVDLDLLSRVRCPIGVPTGGKAPKEVAISLAAELLSIHYANTNEVSKSDFVSRRKISQNGNSQGTSHVLREVLDP